MNIERQHKKIIKKLKKIYNFLILKKKVFVFGIVALPLTSAGAGMTIYIDNLSNTAENPIFTQESVVRLNESVSVEFTVPIQDIKHYESTVEVYPKTNMTFMWNDSQTMLTIMPKTIWQPETMYSIAFPHNSRKASEETSTIFSFETISYPRVITTNISKENNQYINKGEEILITFDRNVVDFDLQAVMRPVLQSEQIYDEQTKTLHVKILEQTQVYKGFHDLTLFAKHKSQENTQYYPIDSMTFNTLLPRPEVYPKQFDERLKIAEESTAPQIKTGKYIDVNLKAQITTLFENGKFVTNFVDSTGAVETPTPPGEYQIYNKNPYALSNMFQVYLPYWLAFTEDGLYGFHGLIVWPEGHEDMPQGGKESKKSIGSAVSAGCVRHDAQNSKFLYDWVDIGTKVVIY